MKKPLFALALLAASLPVFSASQYDGVYSCMVRNTKTGSTGNMFAVIMTKDNGEAFFSTAAPIQTGYYGFALGTLKGNVLTDTSTGETLTIGNTFSTTGVWNKGTANEYTATTTCFKIW